MNETSKTIVFVAVACTAVAIVSGFTWMSRSWEPATEAPDMIGKQLFADFDPLSVTRLQIIKYDEDTATATRFEVAEVDKQYSIPSHSKYPADAKDQLAEAADSVMGRKVLTVAGESPGDHALYGVLDPGDKDLKAGAVGVGTHVTMKDKDDKSLLAMVIGKEVTGQSELRHVRRIGQDAVYTMKVNTDKLSTKFEDWIEKDLLKLNSWDISQIQIRDHSVDEANRGLIQRGEMLLSYDDAGDPKWTMAEDKAFSEEQKDWTSVVMAEDEELDTEKLDALKSALDDLKIVDVRRKPPGLSTDLGAEKDFTDNNEAILSLMNKGFFVADIGGRVELVSNEGEIRSLMKDGVEYVLRFGNATESTAAASEGEEANADLNRYIFVMAEFNGDAIPKPELESLPEEEAQPAEGEEAQPDAEATEEKKDGEESDRERIEKENKQKKEDYERKIADGKKRVNELNARFADWYYIISDEVYQKIHLGRSDIVKKKEKEEGEEGEDGDSDTTSADAPPDQGEAEPNPLQELDGLKKEGPGGSE